ncbi:TPA: rRNA maturation RNase YbeY [Burkholderia multivorans]|uniref:rRNA maturation RNase YbeY n=1 Tax=Burkholderia multivorans TaxID=87883 RepID=UPI001C246A0B|nr:rRNA maturation RNase YbeY [Burkholderia multivorans]MBU9350934.1 rRNA maturation RNase YbeY [Burkholderia multivorans]MBU9393416.1 rRNA maturation RNase YbeY [Burkholderia multivorans]HDR9835279.1 rRNA maturation RNase YbeY [Burkholderia multivorans]HDR9841869.1 rRNA maturation RNase YbeY [Burkholderia multivorans]HDR9847188.1 rRNA maturation RNase YbeY [Burkholderia multivorans]
MKSTRSRKSGRAESAASESIRVSLFDAKGKARTVKAQGLRIDFPDGRSLMFDLSGSSGDAAVAIVAQHNDPAMRAKLALQPEHYDSLTLHVGAEPAPRDEDDDGEQREQELDLSVQYGDEITSEVRKTLPKRKLIAEWLEPALFANAQITVRFVGETEGRTLNAGYRHKDYPTNVLTFAYDPAPDGTVIGDLVLCCPVVEKEAREQDKPLAAHYAHLLVHGALHAQGYDHETSDEDAAEMEALEVDILAKLGFPNPYR